jgi:segregation and condensation protein B
MNELPQHIEALLFAAEQVINVKEIQTCMQTVFGISLLELDIINTIDTIKLKYQSNEYVFELVQIANGYQFLTKPKFHHTVSALIATKAKKKLSLPALECLSIIAYKQPITKFEVEQIRGVNCDYAIQKLLEKELVLVKGRSEAVGKPLLYGTSMIFMDHFGIKNISDLPKIKEFELTENTIGAIEDIDNEKISN